MKLKLIIICIFSIFICNELSAQTGSLARKSKKNGTSVNLELGVDRFFGYALYRIGGTVVDNNNGAIGQSVDPISQLEFPLNVFMASLDVELTFSDTVRLHVNGKKSINSSSGKMEDSDWGIWFSAGNYWADSKSLDVFSESDSSLNSFMIDGDVQFNIIHRRKVSCYFGAGLFYQNMQFDISNLDQSYPSYSRYSGNLSSQYSGHTYISGTGITYDVEYFIPYLVLSPEVSITNDFIVSGRLGFSPYVIANDVDDHILRSKKMTGKSSGTAFLINLRAQYYFSSYFYIKLYLDSLLVDTVGEQTQVYYATTSEANLGDSATIDNELSGRQFSAGIYCGIFF
ncbi:MAG: omptin family outer membrane protease [bacterium]|nr:omptin family outer membrane protease [bacterium]